VQIEGKESGEISFEIDGEALKDILKNRAGLCILHPIAETSGGICELTHADGSRTKASFPVTISADNPFKDLRNFRWKCNDHWYSLNYEGDIFETEDQRNWCDASYKTFCTPLSIPFPVCLKAGEKVHQKVTFKADEDLPEVSDEEKAIEITVLDGVSLLPHIGIAASTESESLSQECMKAIRDLNLHHYRIEVKPGEKNWLEKFRNDCNIADAINLPVEIALHISDESELARFKEMSLAIKHNIAHIILLSVDKPATTQALVDKAASLKKTFPSALIGAGTDYNYRELNVHRFDSGTLDFISYSIDPQEHATDDLTIIENIGGQYETVRSARALYPGSRRFHVSSLTLRKRFNPAATVTADRNLLNDKKADPRQVTEFTAVFTLGSIKSLSIANANSVTFFQTAGRQGVISLAGDKYPVYHLLRQILSMSNYKVRHTLSSDPVNADALLLTHGESARLIMFNYTSAGLLIDFASKKYVLGPFEIRTVEIKHPSG
jgi:D-apionolactonase